MVEEGKRHTTSVRTTGALVAAKACAVKLGGDRRSRFTTDQSAMGRAARIAKATRRAADLTPVLAALKADDVTTMAALAKALTACGIPTSTGKAEWSPMQVHRVLKALA